MKRFWQKLKPRYWIAEIAALVCRWRGHRWSDWEGVNAGVEGGADMNLFWNFHVETRMLPGGSYSSAVVHTKTNQIVYQVQDILQSRAEMDARMWLEKCLASGRTIAIKTPTGTVDVAVRDIRIDLEGYTEKELLDAIAKKHAANVSGPGVAVEPAPPHVCSKVLGDLNEFRKWLLERDGDIFRCRIGKRTYFFGHNIPDAVNAAIAHAKEAQA